MKLLFRRDAARDTKGFISREVVVTFLLHVRMEVTPAERDTIVNFGLGRKVFYQWEPLDVGKNAPIIDINISRLLEGFNMRFTDYVPMFEAEQEIRDNCEQFAFFLQKAANFQKEEVFQY